MAGKGRKGGRFRQVKSDGTKRRSRRTGLKRGRKEKGWENETNGTGGDRR